MKKYRYTVVRVSDGAVLSYASTLEAIRRSFMRGFGGDSQQYSVRECSGGYHG
jgi:hypothetical protein